MTSSTIAGERRPPVGRFPHGGPDLVQHVEARIIRAENDHLARHLSRGQLGPTRPRRRRSFDGVPDALVGREARRNAGTLEAKSHAVSSRWPVSGAIVGKEQDVPHQRADASELASRRSCRLSGAAFEPKQRRDRRANRARRCSPSSPANGVPNAMYPSADPPHIGNLVREERHVGRGEPRDRRLAGIRTVR